MDGLPCRRRGVEHWCTQPAPMMDGASMRHGTNRRRIAACPCSLEEPPSPVLGAVQQVLVADAFTKQGRVGCHARAGARKSSASSGQQRKQSRNGCRMGKPVRMMAVGCEETGAGRESLRRPGPRRQLRQLRKHTTLGQPSVITRAAAARSARSARRAGRPAAWTAPPCMSMSRAA